MKKVILISGKAEAGKTTLANELEKLLTSQCNKVVVTRYAYYLKDIATRYFGWNGVKDKKGRDLLQHLGTDIIRERMGRPNFHVDRVCEDIDIAKDNVDYVIIDDVRFPNEIGIPTRMFKDKVLSIRVERWNEDGTSYENSLGEEQKKHISEIALDEWEFDLYIKARNRNELNRAAWEIANERLEDNG